MKTKYRIYTAALILLLVVLTTHSVSSVSASGNNLPELEGTPPPPSPPPDPGTPEPDGDGGDGDDGGGRKTVLQKIINIVFDYETLKDAIIGSIGGIFEASVTAVTTVDSPLYGLGKQISNIVFAKQIAEKGVPNDPSDVKTTMKDVRLSTWRQMRKVAFALLPLVAALTLWASMKDGLYSVTGYSNTLEAVAELVVSIAIALASYFLMEQAISLTNDLAVAIGNSLGYKIKASVFAGALVKNIGISAKPIMAMIWYGFAFLFLFVFMVSVMIAFLAREVVLVLVVSMAPLMLILGAVRPLGWLRALWFKAFLVVLLLLPVNVLVLGIAVKLQGIAADITTGTAETLFYLIITVGIISILIALNTALGKMVYGAAIEVAQKIKGAIDGVVAMGATLGGMALGAGGFSALAGGVGGGLGGGVGGGTTGGMLAESTASAGTNITQTGGLSNAIETVLQSSGSRALGSFGRGLSAGSEIRNKQVSQSVSQPWQPPLDIANSGIPGGPEGEQDVKAQFDTEKKAAAIGLDRASLNKRTDTGYNTVESWGAASENLGLNRSLFEEMRYKHGGNTFEEAGREFTRAEVGTYALGRHSPFNENRLKTYFPGTQDLHNRDSAWGLRVIKTEQKRPGSPFRDIDQDKAESVINAIHAKRISGSFENYRDIAKSAAKENLQDWLG